MTLVRTFESRLRPGYAFRVRLGADWSDVFVVHGDPTRPTGDVVFAFYMPSTERPGRHRRITLKEVRRLRDLNRIMFCGSYSQWRREQAQKKDRARKRQAWEALGR